MHHGRVTPTAPPVVRRAVPDDAPALASVAAATFPLACPPGTSLTDIAAHVTRHLSAEAFRRYLGDEARTVLVLEGPEAGAAGQAGSGPVLGYAVLVAGEPEDASVAAALTVRPTVLLDKFYLLPVAQGTGAAAVLMAAVTDAAGASGVWLGVNRQNARASAFYERQGFRVVGGRRFVVGTRTHDDDVRERVLAPA